MRKFLLIALLFCFAVLIAGCPRTNARPKLAVVIVIDQFPQYFLTDFSFAFGNDGFKRLINDGAMYANANYSHAVTQTGPGHANIGTGCNPHRHGIVANVWFDSLGQRKPCVECLSAHEVGSNGVTEEVSACPEHLAVKGLGDILKAATNNQAQVWSVSLKDRAAILPAGQKPDGAFWWSSATGEFITSDYYATGLPAWCREFNLTRPADKYFGATWERILPESAYYRCEPDSSDYETNEYLNLSATLPKVITGNLESPGPDFYDAIEGTPFGNELVLDLAKKAVTGAALGADNIPDILWISLSSNDIAGHAFGPHSHEILDITARTDRQVADFLSFLDTTVGESNFVVALSSDHGIAPAPESRHNPLKGGRLNYSALRDSMNAAVNSYLTPDVSPVPRYIESVFIPYVYLNPRKIAGVHGQMTFATMHAMLTLHTSPGVEVVYPTHELNVIYNTPNPDHQARILRNYYEGRSGQAYFVPKPGWVDTQICTTHGSIHEYDTHVPLIFYGAPFKKGNYEQPADPCDLAVTLASVLGLAPLKDVDGHVREECLRVKPQAK